jgi:hypothetical protein
VYSRIEEFLQVLRTVTGNIDPNLFHGADWIIRTGAPCNG